MVTAPTFFSPPPMIELEAAVTLNKVEPTTTTKRPKQKLEQDSDVGLRTSSENVNVQKVKKSGRTGEEEENEKNSANIGKEIYWLLIILLWVLR